MSNNYVSPVEHPWNLWVRKMREEKKKAFREREAGGPFQPFEPFTKEERELGRELLIYPSASVPSPEERPGPHMAEQIRYRELPPDQKPSIRPSFGEPLGPPEGVSSTPIPTPMMPGVGFMPALSPAQSLTAPGRTDSYFDREQFQEPAQRQVQRSIVAPEERTVRLLSDEERRAWIAEHGSVSDLAEGKPIAKSPSALDVLGTLEPRPVRMVRRAVEVVAEPVISAAGPLTRAFREGLIGFVKSIFDPSQLRGLHEKSADEQKIIAAVQQIQSLEGRDPTLDEFTAILEEVHGELPPGVRGAIEMLPWAVLPGAAAARGALAAKAAADRAKGLRS